MSFLSKAYPNPFPAYIMPSLPFRRKSSSASTASSASATSSASTAPSSPASPAVKDASAPVTGLPGTTTHLRCRRCGAELCLTSQIVSRGFTGSQGRAYLVAPLNEDESEGRSTTTTTTSSGRVAPGSLANLWVSRQVTPKNFLTGAHTVRHIACARCNRDLGWKYVSADDESQRYKVGKFILETKFVTTATTDGWDAEGLPHVVGGKTLEKLMAPRLVDGEEVEFDSQDEDECEDLFLGQWTPELALKRRRAKLFMAGK